ncbi:hypothetical protein DVK02_01310 [Halobellus sp. Atlit-31R]|nr:hypothetical protein DVK02_01310 [Halobellus sp. Atlit-31R]
MPEIPVTDEQQATIDEISGDIADAYVDTYGHVRTRDVVQYLLDTYTPPEELDRPGAEAYERIATAEFPALQQIAADVDEVPGSGIDADTMRGKLVGELGVAEVARRLEAVDPERTAEAVDGAEEDGSTGDAGAESAVEDESASAAAPASEATSESESESDAADPDDSGESTDGDPEESGESTRSATPSDPGSLLSTANRLLDAHDDKWRKSAGDAPYEVDLPDGTTAQARTKDDVRQLLFKHY